MLEINPTYVVDAQRQPIAVQISIDQFKQIEALLKSSGHLTSIQIDRPPLSGTKTAEDFAWLESDIGPSFGDDVYEWEEGELEEGKSVRFVSGVGLVIGA
ncbi:MAG: hypothetical protein NT070_21645 [Cyanobacteria bacterium]|nr:hypothetical protein [Cyanobacteriota bacterium]